MITLRLAIIPSWKNSDGAHSIRVVATRKGSTIYITTPYKINKGNEFRNERIVNRADASFLNPKLRDFLSNLQERVDALPTGTMTMSQIRDALMQPAVNYEQTIVGFTEQFIQELNESGRTGYAQNIRRSINDLVACLGGDNRFDVVSPHVIKQLERKTIFQRTLLIHNRSADEQH
jgi:hypothetical protein